MRTVQGLEWAYRDISSRVWPGFTVRAYLIYELRVVAVGTASAR